MVEVGARRRGDRRAHTDAAGGTNRGCCGRDARPRLPGRYQCDPSRPRRRVVQSRRAPPPPLTRRSPSIHGDVWARRTEGNSSIHQTVLTALALPMMRDPLDDRLPDVNRGLWGEMGGRHLNAGHGCCSTWPNQRVSKRASACRTWRRTSGGNTSNTSSGQASSALGGSRRG